MIDTNLTGVWTVCRGAMPHMIEEGRGGAMVLISSVAAHVRRTSRSDWPVPGRDVRLDGGDALADAWGVLVVPGGLDEQPAGVTRAALD
jgi:NAD(P)-dependent dehydrogenase (short-subunit alcohol dehydrogenase family)